MTNVRINRVEIPVGSCDGPCAPEAQNTWAANFPTLDPTRIGIGYIVEPAPFIWATTPFALHDNVYSGQYVPNPARAVITYTFSRPTSVRDLVVVQHTNGITEIEGFVSIEGDMKSIGVASSGLVGSSTGANMFTEGVSDIFEFPTATPASSILQLVINKTSLVDGYATYRIYPRNKRRDPYTVSRVINLLPSTGVVAYADVDPDNGNTAA